MLNDWFGHSAEVAETYYLQTTDADYEEALRENSGTDVSCVGTFVGTSLGDPTASQDITQREKASKSGLEIDPDMSGEDAKYTRRMYTKGLKLGK